MKFQLVRLRPPIFLSTSSPSTGLKFSFWFRSVVAVRPPWASRIVIKALSRRILSLALTMAPAPMAVALVKLPAETLAPNPLAVRIEHWQLGILCLLILFAGYARAEPTKPGKSFH